MWHLPGVSVMLRSATNLCVVPPCVAIVAVYHPDRRGYCGLFKPNSYLSRNLWTKSGIGGLWTRRDCAAVENYRCCTRYFCGVALSGARPVDTSLPSVQVQEGVRFWLATATSKASEMWRTKGIYLDRKRVPTYRNAFSRFLARGI